MPKNIHDWIKENNRSPLDHLTIADLISLADAGGDTATPDPEADKKAARRAELEAELESLK